MAAKRRTYIGAGDLSQKSKKESLIGLSFSSAGGGAYETRTRDPLRDRQIF